MTSFREGVFTQPGAWLTHATEGVTTDTLKKTLVPQS